MSGEERVILPLAIANSSESVDQQISVTPFSILTLALSQGNHSKLLGSLGTAGGCLGYTPGARVII